MKIVQLSSEVAQEALRGLIRDEDVEETERRETKK